MGPDGIRANRRRHDKCLGVVHNVRIKCICWTFHDCFVSLDQIQDIYATLGMMGHKLRPPRSRTSIAPLGGTADGRFASATGATSTATNRAASTSRNRFFQAKNCPLLRLRSRQNATTLWPL